MAHAGTLTPSQQVQLFTGGLPEAIRIDVELQASEDVQRAMVLARAYERCAMPVPSAGAPRPSRPPVRPQPQSGTTSAPTPTPALPIQPSAAVPPRPFKRLTPAEMSERRRQGLCYNCDEQYVRGHKCPRLFYLEVADFDEEAPADDNPSADEQPPLISLHAVTGVRAENTMKLASPLAAGSSRRC